MVESFLFFSLLFSSFDLLFPYLVTDNGGGGGGGGEMRTRCGYDVIRCDTM